MLAVLVHVPEHSWKYNSNLNAECHNFYICNKVSGKKVEQQGSAALINIPARTVRLMHKTKHIYCGGIFSVRDFRKF